MSENRTFPTREKNALDNDKLRLTTVVDGKRASFNFGFVGGNPRVTVYTNQPNDEGKPPIQGNMDLPTMQVFLQLIERAITFVPSEDKAEFRDYVEVKTTRWVNKKPDGIMLVSKLFVGKDKEGCVWLSLVDDKHHKVKFIFAPSEYHNLVHGDGTPWNPAELSLIYAQGYVNAIRPIVNHLAVTLFVDKTKSRQDNNNGGGNRGGNYGGGQRGGSSHDDDDIPFKKSSYSVDADGVFTLLS